MRRPCRRPPSTPAVRSGSTAQGVLVGRRHARNDGNVRTNTARSTPAHTIESAWPCASAGEWNACASDGIAIVAAASRVRVDTIRACAGVEPLRPVSEPTDDERDPEHEHAVREDRADERGLHDVDEPSAQREDRDEELGQVAERGLDDTGAAGAEPGPELLRRRADETSEGSERDRGDGERDDVAGTGVAARRRDEDDGKGHRQLDQSPAGSQGRTVTDPRMRDEPMGAGADN